MREFREEELRRFAQKREACATALRALEATGMASTVSELSALTSFSDAEVREYLDLLRSWGQVREEDERWIPTISLWVGDRPVQYDKTGHLETGGSPGWLLPSTFSIRGLRVGAYEVDAVVQHSIKEEGGIAGVTTVSMTRPPEILALTRLVRVDGEPVGPDFDFREAAIQAVIKASRLIMVRQSADIDMYVGGDGAWREHSRLIREAVRQSARVR